MQNLKKMNNLEKYKMCSDFVGRKGIIPSYFWNSEIYVVLLAASLSSSEASLCTRWHEAKSVIAESDSLLVKGVIMRDTVVLGGTIHVLDNHAGQ